MILRVLIVGFFALHAGTAKVEIRVDNAADIVSAIADAPAGATIIIAPGEHDVGEIKLARNLTLKGEDGATLFSSQPVRKGVLVPLAGVSLHIENVTLRGAVSPHKNGAGIRHEGRDLTIIDVVFDTNENGVLATGEAEGRIAITGARFLNSGHGDGYSHGVYVLRAALLEIRDSDFIGTRAGHHVKSLADRTIVAGSLLDDADGRPSYAVDASKGGAVLITGNRIVQAADARNRTIVNYDLTRGGAALGLTISDNTIVNRRRNGRLLRNATSLRPAIYGNEVVNEGRARLDYRETQRPRGADDGN